MMNEGADKSCSACPEQYYARYQAVCNSMVYGVSIWVSFIFFISSVLLLPALFDLMGHERAHGGMLRQVKSAVHCHLRHIIEIKLVFAPVTPGVGTNHPSPHPLNDYSSEIDD